MNAKAVRSFIKLKCIGMLESSSTIMLICVIKDAEKECEGSSLNEIYSHSNTIKKEYKDVFTLLSITTHTQSHNLFTSLGLIHII